MPLTREERALIRLLVESGQSYAEVGSLLEVDADEVRARARAALGKIGGEDPDAAVGLTDYLLGQADPSERGATERRLSADPEAAALARKLEAQLSLIAAGGPGSEPAGPRSEPAGPRSEPAGPQPAAPAPPPAGKRRAALLAGMRRRQVLVPGLLVVAAAATLITLAATGSFGDDGDGLDPTSVAVLEPRAGGTGGESGNASFYAVEGEQVMLLSMAGLQPAGERRSYVVWLTGPVGASYMLRHGLGGEPLVDEVVSLPEEVLPLLADGSLSAVQVSLAGDRELRLVLREARGRNGDRLYAGETVLAGRIVDPETGEPGPEQTPLVPIPGG